MVAWVALMLAVLISEPPSPCAMSCLVFEEEEDAGQADINDVLEVDQLLLVDRCSPGNPGVVEANVEPAEALHACGDHALDVILVGDVAADREGAGPDLAGGLVDQIGVAVEHRDLRALVGEELCRRQTDARRCACNQGDLAVECSHTLPPQLCSGLPATYDMVDFKALRSQQRAPVPRGVGYAAS